MFLFLVCIFFSFFSIFQVILQFLFSFFNLCVSFESSFACFLEVVFVFWIAINCGIVCCNTLFFILAQCIFLINYRFLLSTGKLNFLPCILLLPGDMFVSFCGYMIHLCLYYYCLLAFCSRCLLCFNVCQCVTIPRYLIKVEVEEITLVEQ